MVFGFMTEENTEHRVQSTITPHRPLIPPDSIDEADTRNFLKLSWLQPRRFLHELFQGAWRRDYSRGGFPPNLASLPLSQSSSNLTLYASAPQVCSWLTWSSRCFSLNLAVQVSSIPFFLCGNSTGRLQHDHGHFGITS